MTESINHLLICKCSSEEHILIASYFQEDDEVFVSVHLAPQPWHKRIANAVRYIFGYRSKYGDFDEILLRPEDWEKVQDIADHLKRQHDAEQK